MSDQVGAIANMLKEAFALWKTFIATRQEAYNRKMDIKKSKAIDNAEKYILTNNKTTLTEDKKKKLLAVYEKRFFHYNN